MSSASTGDTVRVHYTGRLKDGTVFDTSRNREPLEITLGEEAVIPGFESAVEGMEEGEEKTATIPPDDAYGAPRDDLILTVSKDQVPADMDPEVGQRLQMQTQDGQNFQVTVAEIADDHLRLDANHPLAGKELTFDLELVEIA